MTIPDITPERWLRKFSWQPGELPPPTPAPAGTAQIIAALQHGKIAIADAAAELTALGIPAPSAQAIAAANAPHK
jgi:hypothetical protein